MFSGACPWGPSRLPWLTEVLRHWVNLVEDGAWAVEDGVEEDAAWSDFCRSLRSKQWKMCAYASSGPKSSKMQ